MLPRRSRLALLSVIALPLGCVAEPLPDPGEFVLHRLNRSEYDRTVRDLFGTELRPAEDFPADDFGFGYDNIATALSLSPLHVELYERAADTLLAQAFAPEAAWPLQIGVEAEDGLLATASSGYAMDAGYWNLNMAGTLTASVEVPLPGEWFVGAVAFSQAAGTEVARMELRLDGVALGTFDVLDVASAAQRLGVVTTLEAGAHAVSVTFLNDYWAPATGADRNLLVDRFVLEGPYGQEAPPSPRDRLLPCDPETTPRRTCAAMALRAFAARAWRRPLVEDELLRLLSVYDLVRSDGADFEEGLAAAMKAVLMSPRFVFRVEHDPEPSSDAPHPLTPYELASRLSYFLWSSMPDDALFAAAAADELQTDAQLAAQARRMLADPKSSALVDNFAGQWLYVRAVDDAAPDGATWPDFDATLRESLKREMSLFFATFLQQDRSMLELLTSRSGFLDARLAAHYGVDFTPPADGGFAPVEWVDGERGGLLTMGGLLAATSYPLRTSPTRRGKWVLEQLLCQGPPPPPPGVEGLPEGAEGPSPQTLRERLAQHAADPTCASCHVDMDAIGFSLEHFDPVGVWRDEDVGEPIDATAELDGVALDGAQDLAAHLAASPSLPRCMAQQLTTYALGRGAGEPDWRWINTATDAFEASGFRFAALVEAVVLMPTFRSRRGGQTAVDAEGEE